MLSALSDLNGDKALGLDGFSLVLGNFVGLWWVGR